MENTTVSEIPLDFSWAGDYNTTEKIADNPEFRLFVRGSHNAILKIPVLEVSDLNEFVKGFLTGVLHGHGLTMKDVEFQHKDLPSEVGEDIKPAYVHKIKDMYEIETWFVEKTI